MSTEEIIKTCPSGLKTCSYETLDKVADSIRNKILQTVSKTGGHLASNLGSVELTIALHRVFESPKDRIVWDVGHQAYPHKLLTGRWDNFHTLRQKDGVCGYPNRKESVHDKFDVGHSSTSLSGALGMALARDLNGEDHNVVAIIGDGAITAGMAYEALNMIGHVQTPIVVILNENGISISPNVGAFGAYTNRLTNKLPSSPVFREVRKDIHYLLDNIKDEKMLEIVRDLRLKALSVLSDEIVFEALGFAYIGQINGHDIKAVEKALEEAKSMKRPVLVHVKTVKGKGYEPAENNPTKYHGAKPFDIETGEYHKKKALTKYSKVFGNAMVELAKENNKLVGITGAMANGTGLIEMQKAFPHRFYDVGIAEQNAVTMAAGLACENMTPVATIYSTFLQRAFDQVAHDVCMQNLHVIFAMDRAGLVGSDGPTHHGTFDLAYLRLLPNMVLAAPKDGDELRHLLKTAVNYNGPIALRYPRGPIPYEMKNEVMKEIPIGKGEIVKDEDNPDATILAVGRMVSYSMKAAELLEKQGIKTKIINARFIKPLDNELILDAVNNSNTIITVEENNLPGGFGSAVLELLEENNINKQVHRIGIPDEFIEWGTIPELMEIAGLSPEKIAEKVKTRLNK